MFVEWCTKKNPDSDSIGTIGMRFSEFFVLSCDDLQTNWNDVEIWGRIMGQSVLEVKGTSEIPVFTIYWISWEMFVRVSSCMSLHTKKKNKKKTGDQSVFFLLRFWHECLSIRAELGREKFFYRSIPLLLFFRALAQLFALFFFPR